MPRLQQAINSCFTGKIGFKIKYYGPPVPSGHEAGNPIQHWAQQCLVEQGITTLTPGAYLQQFYEQGDSPPEWVSKSIIRSKADLKAFSNDGSNLKEEHQHDLPDIVLLDSINSELVFLDIKSINASKHGRPPNIISCPKLLDIYQCALETNQLASFTIMYLAVEYEVDEVGDSCFLVIKKIRLLPLHEIDLSDHGFQINIHAALQIQFHPLTMPLLDSQEKEEFAKGLVIKWHSAAEEGKLWWGDRKNKFDSILEV